MSDLIFLDLETTGLDPSIHQAWEAAYAREEGDVHSHTLEHSLASADPIALDMNGYHDRGSRRPLYTFERELREALTGATIVGANPAFDTAFLRARWGVAPWHYRMIDLETYAMPALALDRPKGLAFISEQLGVVAPDHSAAADVQALRACFLKLRDRYRGLEEGGRGFDHPISAVVPLP